MNLDTGIVLEFRDIGQPFLVRCLRYEFPVQDILGNKLRICSLPGTTVVTVLDRRFDAFLPADPKYSFVVNLHSMVTFQVIPYSAITFIGIFHVNFFDFISNLFIF